MNTQTKTKLIHKTKHFILLKRKIQMKRRRIHKKLIERFDLIEKIVHNLSDIVECNTFEIEHLIFNMKFIEMEKDIYLKSLLVVQKKIFQKFEEKVSKIQDYENKNILNESTIIQPQEIKN